MEALVLLVPGYLGPGLPAAEPRVTLSSIQEAQIRAELARDYTRIATQIDDAIGLAAN